MDITLKQLRYAKALNEYRHFGLAAERCHVTQPALSQQIRQLEDQWGARLFERRGRSVVPTPIGLEMLAQTERILREMDRLHDLARGRSDVPGHAVRFGIIPTIAPYLLPDVYPALRQNLPDTEFQVSENRTDILLAQLEEGIIDLALIATDPPEQARLTVEPLFDDPFVFAVSTSEPVPSPVDLNAFAKERILLLDEGHCFRDQAIQACNLRSADTSRTFAATSLSTIVQFVANDQGVTLLPTISLRKEATDPRIRILPLADSSASRKLSLVWRASSPFPAFFKQIAGIIRQIAPHDAARPVPVRNPPVSDHV